MELLRRPATSSTPSAQTLVPAEAVDPQDLRVWSTVNGEPRQDSSTKDMVFSVNELVYRLSQFLVLEPGDVINTGTPQGSHYRGGSLTSTPEMLSRPEWTASANNVSGSWPHR